MTKYYQACGLQTGYSALARGGQSYARLRHNVGPGSDVELHLHCFCPLS